jgi:hypothetical protein
LGGIREGGFFPSPLMGEGSRERVTKKDTNLKTAISSSLLFPPIGVGIYNTLSLRRETE